MLKIILHPFMITGANIRQFHEKNKFFPNICFTSPSSTLASCRSSLEGWSHLGKGLGGDRQRHGVSAQDQRGPAFPGIFHQGQVVIGKFFGNIACFRKVYRKARKKSLPPSGNCRSFASAISGKKGQALDRRPVSLSQLCAGSLV